MLRASQRTTTIFWPLRSCLATMLASRPSRWPLPSITTYLESLVSNPVRQVVSPPIFNDRDPPLSCIRCRLDTPRCPTQPNRASHRLLAPRMYGAHRGKSHVSCGCQDLLTTCSKLDIFARRQPRSGRKRRGKGEMKDVRSRLSSQTSTMGRDEV